MQTIITSLIINKQIMEEPQYCDQLTGMVRIRLKLGRETIEWI